ncbi:MAG: hypothetical protein JXR76_14225 [Deltaproteobacteria bacterium]|nr:hypothetical protein [Deltaproteobacteria bacterium]
MLNCMRTIGVLADSAHWSNAVDALLSDLPDFQDNLSLMMSGIIEE